MGTKRASSQQGAESILNTAGASDTKALSGKWSSHCSLGLLEIISSYPCGVLECKEKLIDGPIVRGEKEAVCAKLSFMFLLCPLT